MTFSRYTEEKNGTALIKGNSHPAVLAQQSNRGDRPDPQLVHRTGCRLKKRAGRSSSSVRAEGQISFMESDRRCVL